MARHGESKHFKRSAVTGAVIIPRKKHKYYIKNLPGKHRNAESIALGGAIRDLMKISSNMKEVKYLINSGFVKVDGKKITEPKYNIGFGDLIDIKGEKFTVSFSEKAKLIIVKDETDGNVKRLKVLSKSKGKGGKNVLRMNDGRNIITDDDKIQVQDTVMLNLSTNKIEKTIPFEQGRDVIIYKGKNAGSTGKIIRLEGNSVELKRVGTFLADSSSCMVL
ncbi:MAG: S4 domain-containing protein [Candidatus Parvarchaeota archaeon]|nr:S4 domain-containing protein [Candidatus Parvarchaeota archaeon]